MAFPIDGTIPAASHNPSADQGPMQMNFANIAGFLGIDHSAPGGTARAGEHNQVSFAINQTALPTLATAVGGFFANAGNNVVYQNSNAAGLGIYQLNSFTSNQRSTQYAVSATDFCLVTPWGIVLAWGYVNATPVGVPVVFAIPPASGFTNNTISVTLTAQNGLSPPLTTTGITTTGFTAYSDVNCTLSYFAIGF